VKNATQYQLTPNLPRWQCHVCGISFSDGGTGKFVGIKAKMDYAECMQILVSVSQKFELVTFSHDS